MALPSFPYRRDLRPPTPEGLPEHTDREFEKIETAIAAMQVYIESLEARIVLLEAP